MAEPIKFEPKKAKPGAPFAAPPAGVDVDGHCAGCALNDIGNADRLLARHGRDLVYVLTHGWHAWDGRRWRRDAEEVGVLAKAEATARAIAGEIAWCDGRGFGNRGAQLARHMDESGAAGRLAAMVRVARTRAAREPAEMDARPWLFNVANGTLELGATVRLREARREDLLTRRSEVPFDDAPATAWETFLARVMPDEERRALLARWFGYALSGDVSEQALVMLHGRGANGKTTLLEAIGHVFGDYHQALPFASLLHDEQRRGGEATPDTARLPGARLVTAAEPETGARFSESTLKAMTGGEKITARFLNREFFDFAPAFKLTLSFNTKPTVRGQDDGIWRRLLLVPFDVVIPREERVHDLLETLKAGASGILRWLVAGHEAWQARRLDPPESVRAATESYRGLSDSIGAFLADCTEAEAWAEVRAGELYQLYQRWALVNAEPLKTRTGFGRALADRNLARRKTHGVKRYVGLRLRPDVVQALKPAGDDRGTVGDDGDGSGREQHD